MQYYLPEMGVTSTPAHQAIDIMNLEPQGTLSQYLNLSSYSHNFADRCVDMKCKQPSQKCLKVVPVGSDLY